MRRHLLVTNDFPPKIGGIQNYLWELWRRLDPAVASVYCTPHAGAVTFDAGQKFSIERSPEPVLLPYPWLAKRVRALADEAEAELVLIDPAVPLGLVGPMLKRPYGVLLHGAEVTIPGRLPGARHLLRRVLREASITVSAGQYALTEAERCAGQTLPSVVIPPSVDADRFTPADGERRAELRAGLDVSPGEQVVACVTRLVPRKGMHTLVAASGKLAAEGIPLRVFIGGTGREEQRLRKQADELKAPVSFLGRMTDQRVVEIYQAADLMVMPCSQRWGGLEQEGFGIVFLEAAACGVPQIAGRSGGAHEAVVDGVTGAILDNPDDPDALAATMKGLFSDTERLRQMGVASRERALTSFAYQPAADCLQQSIDDLDLPPSATLR